MLLISTCPALACTSLVVGKDASATGYAMFSRTEDSNGTSAKRFFVYPEGYYKKGETIVDPEYGWTWTWRHDSYRMTATPDMQPTNGGSVYDQAGVNQHGFMMSTTNTTTQSAGVRAVDPLLRSGGFAESLMNTVLLGESKNSEEAISLCAEITETDGMSEMCFWMMCDNEGNLWIMENCGCHRWVAARVPDDKIAIIANDNVIDYVENDPANFRFSEDLEQFAIDNGFAVYGPDGRFNVAASYGTPNGTGNAYRRWMGYHTFAPSLNIALAKQGELPYPTFVTPDFKLSALDIMEYQRTRFEGTSYDISEAAIYFNEKSKVQAGSDNTGAKYTMFRDAEDPVTSKILNPTGDGYITARPVGTPSQKESHIYEYAPEFKGVPGIGARWWFQVGQPEHSVNLPFYGAINDTHPAYKKLVNFRVYDPESAYWIFRDLSMLARSDRKNYGKPLHEYWRAYETALYEEQADITAELLERYAKDKEDASQWITDYTIATAQAAMNRAGLIRKALLKHIAEAPNTKFEIPSDEIPFVNSTLDINNCTGLANVSASELDDIAVALGISGFKKFYAAQLPSDPTVTQTFTPVLYDIEDLTEGRPEELGESFAVLPTQGVKINAQLRSTELAVGGNVSKVRYTAELFGDNYAFFKNSLENVKSDFALYTVAGDKAIELVGPNGAVTLEELVKANKAYIIGDDERATVMIDFYLFDDKGDAVYGSGKLVVPDGERDGYLNTGALWAASYTDTTRKESSSSNCNAGFGVLSLLALVPFAFRRKRQ